MRYAIAFGGAALLAVLPAGPTLAADPPAQFLKECAACHALQAPKDASLAARTERKGPPLYFAGNKFRREWLAAWLQQPVRIRPSGDFPAGHTRTGAGGDAVDPASLSGHPRVAAGAVGEIADFLMSLKPKAGLLAQESYTPGRVPARMGAMDFVKFKGCGACHKDTPKYGGPSGPELYTAWQRLQPAFIVSYIRDPTKWEARSLMPNKHLNTEAIHKLADYLRTIGETEEKPK